MPDDHSEVAPLLPIPNRIVKRLCADDSADSRVKVGHRQALTAANAPAEMLGRFVLCGRYVQPQKSPRLSTRASLISSLTMSYFHTGIRTIIGAEAFHGPVREGKEWDHLAMVIRLDW